MITEQGANHSALVLILDEQHYMIGRLLDCQRRSLGLTCVGQAKGAEIAAEFGYAVQAGSHLQCTRTKCEFLNGWGFWQMSENAP